MKDKDLKNIYTYMGWEESINDHTYPWGNAREFDSNSAWECVQEMERKGDSIAFAIFFEDRYIDDCEEEVTRFLWERNPTNFFNCMGKWLEERSEK